jgi:Flp pilus assembly protein TadG
MNRNKGRSGSTLIEFTLVGIPLIFALVSTFEMARGMWNYQTLAYAVRAGSRYASTHGQGCTGGGNTCGVTVSNVVSAIAGAAVGLPAANFNVVLSSATASAVSCAPLSSCSSNSTAWPPSPDNAAGMDIRISASYTFKSALSMLWPGAGKVPSGTFTFVAYTRQPMQF